MTFIYVSNALGPMQDGHARILAVLQSVRFGKLPNMRSMSEMVPAFRKPSSWFGFFGPADLPGTNRGAAQWRFTNYLRMAVFW